MHLKGSLLAPKKSTHLGLALLFSSKSGVDINSHYQRLSILSFDCNQVTTMITTFGSAIVIATLIITTTAIFFSERVSPYRRTYPMTTL